MKTAHAALRWLILLLGLLSGLLVALLLAPHAASQAASQQSRPRTWHATVGVESTDRAIQGMVFLPGDLWINVGDTVLWTVQTTEGHTSPSWSAVRHAPPSM